MRGLTQGEARSRASHDPRGQRHSVARQRRAQQQAHAWCRSRARRQHAGPGSRPAGRGSKQGAGAAQHRTRQPDAPQLEQAVCPRRQQLGAGREEVEAQDRRLVALKGAQAGAVGKAPQAHRLVACGAGGGRQSHAFGDVCGQTLPLALGERMQGAFDQPTKQAGRAAGGQQPAQLACGWLHAHLAL